MRLEGILKEKKFVVKERLHIAILSIFLSVLLLVPIALATPSYNFEYVVDGTGFTDLVITVSDNQSAEDQIIVLPFSLENDIITIYDEQDALPFDVFESEYGTTIITHARVTNEPYSFYIELTSNSMTNKNGSNWIFRTFVPISLETQIIVNMPKGAILQYISSIEEPLVQARNDQIALFWEIKNNYTELPIEIGYTIPPQAPETESYIIPLLIGIMITASIIAITIIKTYKKRDFSQKILDTLDIKEMEIVQILQKKGKIKQNQILMETGMPKSTLSVVLRRLEKKNIIVKKQYGKINFVELNKDFF